MPHTFERWTDEIYFDADVMREKGEAVNALKGVMVQDSIKRARPTKFAGHDMMVVNEPSRFLVSKVCNILALRYGVAMAYWYDHETNRTECSLRSTEESGIDVSKIAKEFGGGGHRQSAGFTTEAVFELFASISEL